MWPEVEKAKAENRYELVLSGNEVSERVKKEGLDPKIFELTALNYLDIHETNLGAVPDHISKLSHLQSLVLHSNNLESFNSNITKLEKLKLLDLSRNKLKQISEEIDNLINAVTFNFTYNSLEGFPRLRKTQKLTVLNLSNNKLKVFPDICCNELSNLSELKLSKNEIETVPPQINHLHALKLLELDNNKIKVLPGELAECAKLKVLDLKSNPISDRRLLKLIDQCRIKQIIDYVKAHSPKSVTETPQGDNKSNRTVKHDSDSDDENFRYVLKIRSSQEGPKIVVDDSVKTVREFFLACLVDNVTFGEENFKKFIQVQNKLHETVCSKRNSATIATHDFSKLPPGDLKYTTLPPNDLHIHPLNRTITMTGSDLFTRLQTEANNLRKEKKRSTYSGIHKYLHLIEGHARYPCLLNSEGTVISFPPITNSEVSKIHVGTKRMLLEVTSSLTLHVCKSAMEALLKELVVLLGQDLEIIPVKTVDPQGSLRVVYPSKLDLKFEGGEIKVVRD